MSVIEEDQHARMSLPALVGSRLRALRKNRGLTLQDVAKRCGTTPQTIQRLETASMTLSLAHLERLCQAMDIEAFQLLNNSTAERLLRVEAAIHAMRRGAEAMQFQATQLLEQIDETLRRPSQRDTDE